MKAKQLSSTASSIASFLLWENKKPPDDIPVGSSGIGAGYTYGEITCLIISRACSGVMDLSATLRRIV